MMAAPGAVCFCGEVAGLEEPGEKARGITSTIRSWAWSPEASAGESGSTDRMNWPGLVLSLCRLKP